MILSKFKIADLRIHVFELAEMKRSRDTDDESERRGGKAPRRAHWNGGRGGNKGGGGARGFSSYNASQVQSWQRQFREEKKKKIA